MRRVTWLLVGILTALSFGAIAAQSNVGGLAARLRVLSLGIGGAAPTQTGVAELNGGANSAAVQLRNTATGTGASDGVNLAIDSTGVAYLYQNENKALEIGTNGVPRLTISGAGGVTIAGSVTINGKLLPIVVSKTAQTCRASTIVPANDPHLALTIPAAGTYRISVEVPYSSATISNPAGLMVHLTYSGTQTMAYYSAYWAPATGVVHGNFIPWAAGPISLGGQTSSVSNTYMNMAVVTAHLVATTGGVLTFQWSQANTNVNSICLNVGASMSATQI